MKLYRLKKEARQFFPKHLRDEIKTELDWGNLGVYPEALEEMPYIIYGIKVEEDEHGSRSLASGWNKDRSRFSFTIHFHETSHKAHIKVDRDIPLIIEKVQELLIEKFKEYEE